MFKNKLVALLFSFINLVVVLLLIAFVIENTFVKILLGIYVIIFSSAVSFLNREKPKE